MSLLFKDPKVVARRDIRQVGAVTSAERGTLVTVACAVNALENINPSTEKFESAYSTLLINILSSVHAPAANCETDNCYALSNLLITDGGSKQTIGNLENIPEVIITTLMKKPLIPVN